jgi:hypothetical protein
MNGLKFCCCECDLFLDNDTCLCAVCPIRIGHYCVYGLPDRGLILGKNVYFSFLRHFQMGTGSHPTLCLVRLDT